MLPVAVHGVIIIPSVTMMAAKVLMAFVALVAGGRVVGVCCVLRFGFLDR